MMTVAIARFKQISLALEQFLGPLLVFVVSYTHHIYFADDFVSSFFAAFSLVSLLTVMALGRSGLMLALGIQLAFLGWVMAVEPLDLTEQMLFSTSIALALFATYVNTQEEAAPVAVSDQKEKLWQELYDARQEIKSLYHEKQAAKEMQDTVLYLQHQLEALAMEKQQFIEDRALAEEDIKKFASHMHEMALYQETLRQEILRLEDLHKKQPAVTPPKEPAAKSSHYEAMYHQLKQQFEEKSKALDSARKELFAALEELAIVKKEQEEALEATPSEKALMQQLVEAQDRQDALQKAHDEELVGYEEVIQGLLNQLNTKSAKD